MATDAVGIVDVFLSLTVLVSAAVALFFPGRRSQVAGFLVMGVFVTLVWFRLGAVDVALAEAALGTGILSVLLVWLVVRAPVPPKSLKSEGQVSSAWARWVMSVVGLVVGMLLVAVATSTVVRADQYLPHWDVSPQLEGIGVEHGVTGVLLAFRGYDTLLESAVLMLAALTVFSLGRDNSVRYTDFQRPPASDILGFLNRLLAPVLILFGLWILFAGSSDSGGAFQSGAVLASALILMRVSGTRMDALTRWLPTALVVGVIVFVLAAILGPAIGENWLTYPETIAFPVILVVEIFLTLGITAGLYVLYLGLESPGRSIAGESADE